jgi:hypothetical protein
MLSVSLLKAQQSQINPLSSFAKHGFSRVEVENWGAKFNGLPSLRFLFP